MKQILVLFTPLILFFSYGCNLDNQNDTLEKPKLVVGIVVDQMRADYLYRFEKKFGKRGFNRLRNQGFNNKNVHYNYVPTATAPGHASIFTGATPSSHGIISNHWYDRKRGRMTYNIEDSTYHTVTSYGIDSTKKSSGMFTARSPKRLLCPTITDELKRASNFKSKVIGLSLKDRAAILPVGFMANYALWFDYRTGQFVTSSYYVDQLPKWVNDFNAQNLSDSLLNITWDAYNDGNEHIQNDRDRHTIEKKYVGKDSSTFPYRLSELRKQNAEYELLSETPYGNTLLTDLAIATLKAERLGKQGNIDFLTISYSSTDLVGHAYGVQSAELEDTYVRLDQDIARLLDYLDGQIGKGNYLVFLTSDHGAGENPVYLESIKMPGKFYYPKKIKEQLNQYLSIRHGKAEYVLYADKTQLYIDREWLSNDAIRSDLRNCLKDVEGLSKIMFADEYIQYDENNNLFSSYVKNSYCADRSGDLYMQFEPGWMGTRKYGASHSTAYRYDTHVPLLWYGWNIPVGKSSTQYPIVSIAPTLSMLLDIPMTDCSFGRPIDFKLK